MTWHGPVGNATSRGLRGFEAVHPAPFLKAVPDRAAGNHKARLAERNYVASTGWPSIVATHAGGGWLNIAATGRRIGVRVMDFVRRDGDLLAENWVFVEIPPPVLQFGQYLPLVPP